MSAAREESDAELSIGDLAARTGVSAATLRMWEHRHDFPVPHRLGSGHRRYTEADVDAVARVRARQEAGVRLEVAIAQALAQDVRDAEPGSPSVYAELRRRHPQLAPYRLSKATLLALSWAIEDDFCARADRPVLFGSFQRGRYFEHSRDRWAELSRVATSSFVLGDFTEVSTSRRPVQVQLPEDAPMRREWAVVCDASDLPVALTAWELPGQGDVRDRDRVFESVWTLDPVAVRDASRVCARVATDAGAPGAVQVMETLATEPTGTRADLASTTAMFNRVLSYVDGYGRA